MPAIVLPPSCTRLAKYAQKHRVRHTGGKISETRQWCCSSATYAATQKITICDGYYSSRPVAWWRPVVPERGVTFWAHRAEAGGHMPDREHLNFPILSDMNNRYETSLSLAIWVGAKLQQYMTGIGRMLLQCQGNDSWMLPI